MKKRPSRKERRATRKKRTIFLAVFLLIGVGLQVVYDRVLAAFSHEVSRADLLTDEPLEWTATGCAEELWLDYALSPRVDLPVRGGAVYRVDELVEETWQLEVDQGRTLAGRSSRRVRRFKSTPRDERGLAFVGSLGAQRAGESLSVDWEPTELAPELRSLSLVVIARCRAA